MDLHAHVIQIRHRKDVEQTIAYVKRVITRVPLPAPMIAVTTKAHIVIVWDTHAQPILLRVVIADIGSDTQKL